MSDAPKKGQGRPRKYTLDEAKLRKCKYNRARAWDYVNKALKAEAEAEADLNNLEAILIVPTVSTALAVLEKELM